MRIFKPIELFFRNLRDSFKYSLKEMYKKSQMSRLNDDLILHYILYGSPHSSVRRPVITTSDETINEIITTDKSLVRFADGEIVIVDGGGIPFQKADKRLAKRLQEILTNTQENLIVTLSRAYYYPDIANILQEPNNLRKNFKLYGMPALRAKIDKYINYDAVYYDGIHREVIRGGGRNK